MVERSRAALRPGALPGGDVGKRHLTRLPLLFWFSPARGGRFFRGAASADRRDDSSGLRTAGARRTAPTADRQDYQAFGAAHAASKMQRLQPGAALFTEGSVTNANAMSNVVREKRHGNAVSQ